MLKCPSSGFALSHPLWDDFGRVRSWVALVSCKQPEPGSALVVIYPNNVSAPVFGFFFIPIWGRFPTLRIFFKWVATTKLERLGRLGLFKGLFHQTFVTEGGHALMKGFFFFWICTTTKVPCLRKLWNEFSEVKVFRRWDFFVTHLKYPPGNLLLKMFFLLPRWDMLVP